MNKFLFRSITICMLYFMLLAVSFKGFADNRNYVWTYQYSTLDKGSAEVEYYLTFSTPEIRRMRGLAEVEHQLEIEVGMTDKFDFGIYQVFTQAPGKSIRYDGMKMRARYRFGEKGRWFIDPLVYGEYKVNSDFSKHALEIKLIVARDFSKFNIAVNGILEVEKEAGAEWEIEPEYSVGLKYQFHRLFAAGVEFKGGENGHYAGPVISHGTESVWVTLGSAFKISGISAGKPEFQVRLLLGLRPF